MKKLHLITISAFIITLLSLNVLADYGYKSAWPTPINTGANGPESTGANVTHGIRIMANNIANDTIVILQVNKTTTGSGATIAMLCTEGNCTAASRLATGTFVGNSANLSPEVALVSGTLYYLMVTDQAAAWNSKYGSAGTFPQAGTYLNITGGMYRGNHHSTVWQDLVNFSYRIGSVSTTLTQNTYNFSSGINSTDQIAWQTNLSYVPNTYDTTPTIYVETSLSDQCVVTNTNANYSTALTGTYYHSAEGNSTTHTFTWGSALTTGANTLYLACDAADQTTGLSTSGSLNFTILSTTPAITFVSPTTANNTYANLAYQLNISSETVFIGGTVNITHYVFNSSGSIISQVSTTGTTHSSTHNLTDIGTYYFNATASNSTNTTLSYDRTIQTYTTVNITNPNVNGTSQNNAFNLTWNTSYPVTGVTYIVEELNSSGSIVQTLESGTTNLYHYIAFQNDSISAGTSYFRVKINDSISSFENDSVSLTANIINYVNITVLKASDSTPLNGFTARFTNGTTINNFTASGNSLITNVTTGTYYTISLEASGYVTNTTVNITGSGENYYFLNYSLTGLSGLNITFYDEDNLAVVNFSTVYLDIISSSYSINYTTTDGNIVASNISLGDYILRYNAGGYTQRFFYVTFDNTTEANTTDLSLYLVNDSLYSNITIYLIDEFTSPVPGYQITASKYYLYNNSYFPQEIAVTDTAGKVFMSLTKNDEFYKFTVTKDGVTYKVTDAAYIVDDDIYITIGAQTIITGSYKEYSSITKTLTFDTSNNQFVLNYDYTSGGAEGTLLTVYKRANLTLTLFNTTSSTNVTSGTLEGGVNPVNGTTYVAYAYYYSSEYGAYQYLTGLTYTYDDPDAETSVVGSQGLLLQTLLTIGVSSIAFINVPAAMILTPTSVWLGKVIGLNSLSYGSIIILMVLGVVFMFAIIRNRS